MIHRLNEQVLDSADSAAVSRERKQDATQRRTPGSNVAGGIPFRSDRLSPTTSSLRNLVEDNAKQSNLSKLAADPSTMPSLKGGGGNVSEEANNGDDDDSDIDGGIDKRAPKRTKVS